MDALKQGIAESVDGLGDELAALSSRIHAYPEMAFEVAKLFKTKDSSQRQHVLRILPTMGKEGRAAVMPLKPE